MRKTIRLTAFILGLALVPAHAQFGPTSSGVSGQSIIAGCGASSGQILYDNSGTCAGLATTGSGNAVLATSPTLVTPTLGVATATSYTGPAVGVKTNSNAAAGNVGEFTNSQCPGPTTTATVTVTIATPAVVTWTAHPFLGTAPRFDVCPVVFTNSGGALPTGITTGTTYYVAPASISGNTFSLSTTVANAIANTLITTSGSQSGTQTGTAGVASATGTRDVSGLPLTAGDWDCAAQIGHTFASSASVTILKSSISGSSVTDGTIAAGTLRQLSTAANVMPGDTSIDVGPVRQSLSGTTNVFLVDDDTFTVGTDKAYGTLRCRRVR